MPVDENMGDWFVFILFIHFLSLIFVFSLAEGLGFDDTPELVFC